MILEARYVIDFIAAVKATGPSLAPRSSAGQVLAVAGAVCAAHATATALGWLTSFPRQDDAWAATGVRAGWVAVALLAAAMASWAAKRWAALAAVTTAGWLTAGTAGVHVALTLLDRLDQQVATAGKSGQVDRWLTEVFPGIGLVPLLALLALAGWGVATLRPNLARERAKFKRRESDEERTSQEIEGQLDRLNKHLADPTRKDEVPYWRRRVLAAKRLARLPEALTEGRLITPVVVGAGLAVAVLGAVGTLYRLTGRLAEALDSAHSWPRPLPWIVAALLVLGSLLLLGAVAFWLVRWYLGLQDGRRNPAFRNTPRSKYVSGRGDERAYRRLGRHGQRFVSTAPTDTEVAMVTRSAQTWNPIRIYVGYRSGAWLFGRWKRRVAMAMKEIKDQDALGRKVVVLATPTGGGGIDEVAIGAIEYLTRGNCATVVMQYGFLPSWLSVRSRRVGRKQMAALHQRVLKKRPEKPGSGPRVLLFGESLGALISQEPFVKQHLDAVIPRAGDGALWVGTPGTSRWLRKTLRASGTTDRRVREFASAADLAARRDEETRIVLVSHADDPVGRLTWDLLFRRPDWLREPHRQGAATEMRWLPGVTLLQLVADTIGGSNSTPGYFTDKGHDYSKEMPELVREAFGLTRPAGFPPRDLDEEVREALRFASIPISERPAPAPTDWPPRKIPVLELRVHGVGGASPASSMNYPTVSRVAGDQLGGFYRGGTPEEDLPEGALRRREVYAWGAMTSGAWHRALWVLLLPFDLVNISFWMSPPVRRKRERAIFTFGALHRLLALALTASFTVTLTGLSAYLMGWHCGPAGCSPVDGPLDNEIHLWPTSAQVRLPLPDAPPVQLALTGLLPLVALAVVWALGRWSRTAYEQWPPGERVTSRTTSRAGRTTPLSDPHFWRGMLPVGRLQSLHSAAALALLAMALCYPAHRAGTPGMLPLLILAAVFVAAAAVGVASERLVGRPAQRGSSIGIRTGIDELLTWFSTLALLVLLLTAYRVGTRGFAAPGTAAERTTLPGFERAFAGLLVAQLALLLALAWVIARIRDTSRRRDEGYAPAFRGFAALLVSGLSVLVGGAYSSGLLLLSMPRDGFRLDTSQVRIPGTVSHVAVAATAGATGLVTTLAVMWVLGQVVAYHLVGSVNVEYELATRRGRMVKARQLRIARAWARYWLIQHLSVVAVVALLVAVAALAVGRLGPVNHSALWQRGIGWCQLALVLMVGALLSVTAAALRNPAQRRLMGILWDVASVWPRAVHPFAAPCYAEKAVPDLVTRMQDLLCPRDGQTRTSPKHLVLVGYSQGSVLTAAAIEQLDREVLERVSHITCGSPLRSLYARYFPAYFDRTTLLGRGGPGGPLALLIKDGRWHNFYRSSDFIGSWVQRRIDPPETTSGADTRLLDPFAFDPPPGDLIPPPIRRHGGYFSDPRFVGAVNRHTAKMARRHPAEGAGRGSGPNGRRPGRVPVGDIPPPPGGEPASTAGRP